MANGRDAEVFMHVYMFICMHYIYITIDRIGITRALIVSKTKLKANANAHIKSASTKRKATLVALQQKT